MPVCALRGLLDHTYTCRYLSPTQKTWCTLPGSYLSTNLGVIPVQIGKISNHINKSVKC